MQVRLWPKARRGDLAAVAMVHKIGEYRLRLVTLIAESGPGGSAGSTVDAIQQRRRERPAQGVAVGWHALSARTH